MPLDTCQQDAQNAEQCIGPQPTASIQIVSCVTLIKIKTCKEIYVTDFSASIPLK